ncbi:hypothetical protein QTP86_003318 [Hemibagrus guttatus]|nr:hypothetical protein QTP86_003318 [Hemibagrus guttatus]
MLYGLETVSLRKRQESELEVAELKMLSESSGYEFFGDLAAGWANKNKCLLTSSINVKVFEEAFRQSLYRFFCPPTVCLPMHSSL